MEHHQQSPQYAAHPSPHSAYSTSQSPGSHAYSTLEHNPSLQNGQYPEASAYSNLPEVNHAATPPSEYAHYTHSSTGQHLPPAAGQAYKKEADAGAYAMGPGHTEAGDHGRLGAQSGAVGAGAHGAERRICGVKRKLFWILLVTAVVIVVAAIGGGVGGALASKSKAGDSAASPSNGDAGVLQPPTPSAAPLALYEGTRLASSNFTDQFGNDNFMVIYQVNNGGLYMSSWNTSVSKWVVSPVADGKTNALKLDEIALGTTISLDTYNEKTVGLSRRASFPWTRMETNPF